MGRDTYLDSVKAVLIFFVILGHCITRIGENTECITLFFNVIYSFHMPLFVFISGFFFQFEQRSEQYYKELYGTVFRLSFVSVNMDHYSPPHSLNSLLSPAVTLWYLLCLVYWKLILLFIKNWISVKLLIAVVLLSILTGFVPLGTQFSFQRLFTFFPFFIAGNLLRGRSLSKIKFLINKWVAIGFLIAVIVGLSFADTQWKWLLFGDRSYYGFPCSLTVAPFFRLGYYVFASFLSVVVLALIPDRRFLAKIGTKTMTIYLFHFFPIWGLKLLGVKTGNIVLLVTIALIILLVTLVLDRIPLIKWMTKPVRFNN